MEAGPVHGVARIHGSCASIQAEVRLQLGAELLEAIFPAVDFGSWKWNGPLRSTAVLVETDILDISDLQLVVQVLRESGILEDTAFVDATCSG